MIPYFIQLVLAVATLLHPDSVQRNSSSVNEASSDVIYVQELTVAGDRVYEVWYEYKYKYTGDAYLMVCEGSVAYYNGRYWRYGTYPLPDAHFLMTNPDNGIYWLVDE